jgi:hypothetical protein
MNPVRLSVSTSDGAGEIFVYDGLFRQVAQTIGSMTVDLTPGMYKVKVREGLAEQEEVVVLRGEPLTRSYAVRFSSPIPLRGIAEEDPLHILAVQEQCAGVQLSPGSGSGVFVFARRWRTGGPANDEKPLMAGLTLRNAAGDMVADLGEHAVRAAEQNPWAACSINVDPGAYRLAGWTSKGSPIEHTIVAVSGWQTQVFLQQRMTSEGGAPDNDLPDAAVVYSPDRTFDPDSRSLRLAELARIGLRTDRKVLPNDVISEIISGEFRDPMLGLLGGHLAVRQRLPDTTDLTHTVARLRELLGFSHPDVEALTLYPGGTPTQFVFTVPPSLKKSWLLVVDASARNPGLVPADSVAARVAGDLSAEEPWLFWSGDAQKAPAADELVKALNAVAARLDVSPPKSQPSTLIGSLINFGITKWLWSMRTVSRTPEERAMVPSVDDTILKSAVTEATIQFLVETLRLPRGNVERMIEKLKQKDEVDAGT